MWSLTLQLVFLAVCLQLGSSRKVEKVHIRIGENILTKTRGCQLKSEIAVTVMLQDTLVNLNLKRNDDVNLNVPVYTTGKDGRVEEVRLLEIHDSAEYQDEATLASMTVTCRQSSNENIDLSLHGLITLENRVYSLERTKRVRRDASSINDEYELVEQVAHNHVHDYRQPPDAGDMPEAIHEDNHLSPLKFANEGRHKRQTSSYYIDVLAVIDYSIYKRWYDKSSQTSPALRDIDALQNIRKYYAYIMNGVNLRYKTITSLNSALNVRLVGFYIGKTSATAPWSETYVINSDQRLMVDADKVLSYLYSWANRNVLPSNDHIMAFTGYDMYSESGTVRSTATSGLAYIGTLCSTRGRSLSLVEDLGAFQCVDTAAHELGHSLGAKHDGDGNNCKASDRFIMSGGTYKATQGNLNNPWLFSTCSVDYFRNFLINLSRTRSGLDCITRTFTSNNVPDVTSLMPGQQYNPDEQCKMMHGSGSRLCQGPEFGNYSSVCTSMFCLDSSTQGTCWQLQAARGTSCGNKKWCIDGSCQYSPEAPQAVDDCVFGDQKGISFDGQTCEDFTAGDKSPYCYQDVVRLRCCASCARYYTGVASCLYGDKVRGCQSQFCDYEYEDGTLYSDNCCQTCSSFTTRPPTTARPTTRVTTRATTRVTTTPRVVTTTSAVRTTPGTCNSNYGDTLGLLFDGLTCEEYVSSDPSTCYTDTTQTYCCYSCRRRDTGRQGCEFGDKLNSCYTSLCGYVYADGERYSTYCCDTCRYGTTTPVATTPTTTPTVTSTTTRSGTCTEDSLIFGVTCEAYLGTYGTGRCYNDAVASACCRSCADKAGPRKGCEYGDKNTEFCGALPGPLVRACQGVQDVCCDTCRDFVTTGAEQVPRSLPLMFFALLLAVMTVFRVL